MTSLLADDRLLEMTEESSSVPMWAPAGVAKTFREYDPTQSFRLPPSLDDRRPQEHRARFIAEVADELPDLTVTYDRYVEVAGASHCDPAMMLKLLPYACSVGVTSSCEMERRSRTDVAFRWLSANAAPDYRLLSRCRRCHHAGVRARVNRRRRVIWWPKSSRLPSRWGAELPPPTKCGRFGISKPGCHDE